MSGRKKKLKKTFDRNVLITLYIREKKYVKEVAKILGTTPKTIAGELKRHGIEKRSSGYFLRKYPELYEMKAGETITIKRPDTKSPTATIHSKATMLRIKVSVKSIDGDKMEIYRIK